MKIELASVYVNDVNDAFDFYTQTLGFVEKLHMPEAFLAIVAAPEDPKGTSILLEPNDSPVASTYQKALYEAKLPTIVFSAKDIQQEYQRLADAGVKFRKAPTQTEWGWEALFEDTCGNLIQLTQQ